MARRGKRKDETAAPADGAAPVGASRGLTAITTLILSDIAVRAGKRALSQAVDRTLGTRGGGKKLPPGVKKPGIAKAMLGTAIARVATRSVPGAIAVGGGLLAKTLYDRRHAKKPAADQPSEDDKAADSAEPDA